MKSASRTIFTLPWQTISCVWLRLVLRYTHGFLECILGLRALQKIYEAVCALPKTLPFSARVLQVMQTHVNVAESDVERIPESGALIVIANHPFGASEGLALLETVRAKRRDVKILGNYILRRIPELESEMFFVDPFGKTTSAARNTSPVRQALHWLQRGHALILFPAGEVASFQPRAFRVRDAMWHVSLLPLLRKAKLPVTILPVFIPGSASVLFHLAGKLHPRLRTLLLPRELLRKRNATITLHIGRPITTEMLFERFASNADALLYLRFRTFLIAGRENETWLDQQMRRLTLDSDVRDEAPVVAPVPTELIIYELENLPAEATLLTTDDHIIYAVQGKDIPVTLQEIGRLRELTFRAAGEGTGNTADIDRFDKHYYQIILWQRHHHEIVGCYRLALSDTLVETQGLNALYTRTLFQFDERFLGHLPSPAIELGRSFVRERYQRSFAPLLLLWRGVLTFIAKHPRYTTLFGPVSISHAFTEASATLLLMYLREHAYDHSLSEWIAPRLPPKSLRFAEWRHPDYHAFLTAEADVNVALEEFENGKREMPTLIRQYLKLGGKMVAFNVDPEFGTTIDGLIVVDLLKAPPRDIARYMGKQCYQYFCEAQTKEALCES